MVWGNFVDVAGLNTELVTQRRELRGLSKAEAGRRMYAYLAAGGPGARDGVALTGRGPAWATEPACRRAIDDLEDGHRFFKEAHYVDALPAVLGLERREVGLPNHHAT